MTVFGMTKGMHSHVPGSSVMDSSSLFRSVTAPKSGGPQNAGPSDRERATMTDLSDRAKTVMERAKADKAIADRLQTLLDEARGKKTYGGAKAPRLPDGEAVTKTVGARVDRDVSRQDLTDYMYGYLDSDLVNGLADSWAPFDPDKSSSFKAAILDGSLKVQTPHDIPGSSDFIHHKVTYTSSSIGSGMFGSFRVQREELNAVVPDKYNHVMWNKDYGSIILTWGGDKNS